MGLGDVMVSERRLWLRFPRHSQDHSPLGERFCPSLVQMQLVFGEERVRRSGPLNRFVFAEFLGYRTDGGHCLQPLLSIVFKASTAL